MQGGRCALRRGKGKEGLRDAPVRTGHPMGTLYPGPMESSQASPASVTVTFDDVEQAAGRIADDARETPVIAAGELSRRLRARLTLKAECLQATGSFKVR